MSDYYVPPTREALIRWLKMYHMNRNLLFKGYNEMTTKQLYAIFYRLREEYDRPQPITKEI